MSIQLSRRVRAAATGGILAAALSACASTPIPNENIAVAKASVQRAEQAGAAEYAPVQIASARDKLAQAEKAAADHDGQPALRLAEQANADAQLAEAVVAQQRSHKAAMEFDTNMQTLRNESTRNAQPAQ